MPADAVGTFAKYSPPIVANGKVYLATFSGRVAGLRAQAMTAARRDRGALRGRRRAGGRGGAGERWRRVQVVGSSGAGAAAGGATARAAARCRRSTPQKLLLRDEAQSMVSYVEIGNPAAGWHVTVPYGRDLQLVGNGRFLIGTDSG